jgi:hypothetical protein
VDRVVFAAPLDAEALLAALGVPKECAVAEAKPLYCAGLLNEVRDTGGVQGPEAVVTSECADHRANLEGRFERGDAYPHSRSNGSHSRRAFMARSYAFSPSPSLTR